MPIMAEWDNADQTIIRIHLHDPWEIDEYFQATSHAWTLIESVEHAVHLIVDFTDAFSFPKNLRSGAVPKNIHIHPRQGLVIGVKFSPYLRAVMGAAVRIFPRLGHNLYFAHTVSEAYELINRHPIKPK